MSLEQSKSFFWRKRFKRNKIVEDNKEKMSHGKKRKYIQVEGKVNRSNKIQAVSYKACKGTLILDTISRIFWER